MSAMTAGQRQRAGTRLERNCAGHGRDHDGAGLGLPPGIDDGAAALADDAVVPFPGRGIDRFADRAEQPEARKIVRIRPLIALANQGADRGGRGVDDIDAVLFDHAPPAAEIGIVRRALVHHGGRAGRKRPVDDVAVAGDPADVGGTPVGIFLVEVEDPFHRGM